MDYSKLPKLSETKPEPTPKPLQYTSQRDISVGAEIWISFALGVLLMYVCNRPAQYLLAQLHLTGFTWTFQDQGGNPITYPQSDFFLPDVGVFALGVIMVIDGLQMLLARSFYFAIGAAGLTLAGTLLNGFALVQAQARGEGFQLWNFVAIVLGGYTAFYQINAVRRLRAWRADQSSQ